jgi:hypothetical protein
MPHLLLTKNLFSHSFLNNYKMETITLKAFIHLIIVGSFNVSVIKSKTPFISFERGLTKFQSLQKDDTLSLTNDSKKILNITIGVKNISSLKAKNTVSVIFTKNCISSDEFKCEASNECDISISNNYSNILSLKLEKNSKFYGEQFPVSYATILINGSGLANINCNLQLKSIINGSGSISNSGKAKSSETKSFSNTSN